MPSLSSLWRVSLDSIWPAGSYRPCFLWRDFCCISINFVEVWRLKLLWLTAITSQNSYLDIEETEKCIGMVRLCKDKHTSSVQWKKCNGHKISLDCILVKIGPNFQFLASKWHLIASNTQNLLFLESDDFLQGPFTGKCNGQKMK